MKKLLCLLSIIVFIIIGVMVNTVNATNEFGLRISTNSRTIKLGNDIVYNIELNDRISECSFKLEYDNTALQLIQTQTEGFSANVVDGKINCTYVDSSSKGTSLLQIKFKTLKTVRSQNLIQMQDARFIIFDSEDVYTTENIQGIDAEVKIDIVEEYEHLGDYATFNKDSGVECIKVYYTRNYALPDETDAPIAYSRTLDRRNYK